MSFANPENLTDAELRKELEAAKNMLPDIMASDDVVPCHKDEWAQYVKALIQEQEKRTNEEWMYPLEAFGITAF